MVFVSIAIFTGIFIGLSYLMMPKIPDMYWVVTGLSTFFTVMISMGLTGKLGQPGTQGAKSRSGGGSAPKGGGKVVVRCPVCSNGVVMRKGESEPCPIYGRANLKAK